MKLGPDVEMWMLNYYWVTCMSTKKKWMCDFFQASGVVVLNGLVYFGIMGEIIEHSLCHLIVNCI